MEFIVITPDTSHFKMSPLVLLMSADTVNVLLVLVIFLATLLVVLLLLAMTLCLATEL